MCAIKCTEAQLAGLGLLETSSRPPQGCFFFFLFFFLNFFFSFCMKIKFEQTHQCCSLKPSSTSSCQLAVTNSALATIKLLSSQQWVGGSFGSVLAAAQYHFVDLELSNQSLVHSWIIAPLPSAVYTRTWHLIFRFKRIAIAKNGQPVIARHKAIIVWQRSSLVWSRLRWS